MMIAVALLGAACSGGDARPAAPATTTGTTPGSTTRSTRPAVEPNDCPYSLPDESLRCGVLEVPEDWEAPSETVIQLPYVILPALGDPASHQPDPIVYLEGGPGVSGLASVALFADIAGLRQERDIVFMEIRGNGVSLPAFTCEPGVLDDPALATSCWEASLAKGMDPSEYNTRSVALDFVALRRQLGIEQWNLYGISYGTTTAQVISDLDPGGTRSVALDSPTSPSVEIARADLESLLDGYSRIFAACVADPSCDRRYPNLMTTFIDTAQSLSAAPWDHGADSVAELISFVSDEDPQLMEGAGFLRLVQAVPAAQMPAVIHAVAARDARRLDDLLASVLGFAEFDILEGLPDSIVDPSFAGDGMLLSTYCSEEAPVDTLDTVPPATIDEWPSSIIDVYRTRWEICDSWPVSVSAPEDVDLVRNDLPTLILTGEFDVLTPRQQGEIILDGLTNAQLVDVPTAEHGVAPQSQCALDILVAFIAEPTTNADTGCLDEVPPVEWA
jgi:pimeloyl-ACP methyl ester carboxylesterase